MSKSKQAQKEERKRLMGILLCGGIVVLLIGAMIATGFIEVSIPSLFGDRDDDGGGTTPPPPPATVPVDNETDIINYAYYQITFVIEWSDIWFLADSGHSGFIPAVGDPIIFDTWIYPIYEYDVPSEQVDLPMFDGSASTVIDYPIPTDSP